MFDDIITMNCIVMYSIKLNWRQFKVVFRVGTRNTNCDIQQQSNAIKRLYLVYETTVDIVECLCGFVVKCKCFLFANYQQHNYCMFLLGIILLTQCYYHRGTR